MAYSITEPHPTTRPNQYTHCGRGGAGNMYKPSSSSKTSASKISLRQTISNASGSSTSSSSGKFSSGRGGAGNIRPSKEAAHFSFDEELSLQTTREQNHSVWHVGRGGAGNWTRTPSASESSDDELRRKTSSESNSSNASHRSGNWLGRISGAFERH